MEHFNFHFAPQSIHTFTMPLNYFRWVGRQFSILPTLLHPLAITDFQEDYYCFARLGFGLSWRNGLKKT